MALPTVTQPNFNGVDAGFYISAALKQANSLEYMTLMENIKYKMNIQQMASTGAIADATCDFTTAGTLALTERVLEPKNLQVNLELCKGNLLDSWTALTLRAGAGGTSPTFDEYLISYIASTIAQGTEESIWNGSGVAASGQFLGLTTPVNGTLLAAQDGDVVQVVNSGGAGVAYTASTILDNLDLVAAAIPTSVYGKEDFENILKSMSEYSQGIMREICTEFTILGLDLVEYEETAYDGDVGWCYEKFQTVNNKEEDISVKEIISNFEKQVEDISTERRFSTSMAL